MRINAAWGVLALAIGLAACGQQGDRKEGAAPDVAAAPETPSGPPPPAFAQCRACHSVEKGKHGVGPSLAGVYGTKAGDIPDYTFSDAMKNSGITWDDATLDTWLQSPSKMVPGTKMVFFGMPDPERRKAVIEYIKTLK